MQFAMGVDFNELKRCIFFSFSKGDAGPDRSYCVIRRISKYYTFAEYAYYIVRDVGISWDKWSCKKKFDYMSQLLIWMIWRDVKLVIIWAG